MSILIGPLYHWAPGRMRAAILRDGLKVLSPARTVELDADGTPVSIAFPWICLATSPSSAWGLVLDAEAEHPDNDGEGWDLWQIELSEHDHVRVLDHWAPYLREVRILNSIPANKCWWVARRIDDLVEQKP